MKKFDLRRLTDFYGIQLMLDKRVLRLIFTTLISTLFANQGYSQEIHDARIFHIEQTGKKYSENFLRECLITADWCQSINPTSNYKITFDDGAIVNVISYKELSLQHLAIEESCIRSEDLEDTSIYSINGDGFIIRFVQRIPAKTVIKN